VANVEKIQRWLDDALAPGERVEFAAVAQVKSGKKALAQRAGFSALASTAATVAANVVLPGSGVGVLRVPPSVWCVVTSERLLLLEKTEGFGSGMVGAVVLNARRQDLTASLSTGLLNTLTISAAGDGESLLRLNLGVKRDAAATIAAACSG